jgi:transposase-like protein
VDTSREVRARLLWTVEEKRRIAEETLRHGTSVARTVQSYALNADQLFYWRRQYREGRLERAESTRLLPVSMAEEAVVEAVKVVEPSPTLPVGYDGRRQLLHGCGTLESKFFFFCGSK